MASQPTSTASRPARRLVLACLAACVSVLALDSLVFRTGFYAAFLDPQSSTGTFELTLRSELDAQKRNGDRMVVTFGSSRFFWSPKVIDQRPGPHLYVLRCASVPGTDARTWYYLIRDLDPTARRYRALVFGVDDYDDEDRAFNTSDDIRVLHYAIARLRWSDTLAFTRSFDNWEARFTALSGLLLKGTVYRRDVQEFLSNPKKRLVYVHWYDRQWANMIFNYKAPADSMAGLAIDWPTLRVTFPPGANATQRDSVMSFLAHPPDPQTGRLAAFQRRWFGRILDRYRGSPTKLVFLRLPRGPVPRPDNLTHKLSSSIRELASRPNVILMDEHAFDTLERPELFQDGMHLNREGIERFSLLLEDEINRVLR